MPEIPVEIIRSIYKTIEINRSDPYSDKKQAELKLLGYRIVDEDNYSRHIKIYY